jgi:hypothetical protein
MRIPALRRQNPVTWRRAQRLGAFLGLAAVMLWGVTWAKVSRYNGRAVPSCHFSASVKIARVLFFTGMGDEPQALVEAGANLPEPDWSGFASLPEQVEMAGAPPLAFQAFRAPPVQL